MSSQAMETGQIWEDPRDGALLEVTGLPGDGAVEMEQHNIGRNTRHIFNQAEAERDFEYLGTREELGG